MCFRDKQKCTNLNILNMWVLCLWDKEKCTSLNILSMWDLCLGDKEKCMSINTLSMWVLSFRDRTGEVCINPRSVAMSSSPWGERISCCMMLRACWRQASYCTIPWTHRAPPHSRNTSVKQGIYYKNIHTCKGPVGK